jgi:SAM-dependent methyltransferase
VCEAPLAFRRDLYRGTAAFYDQYRLGYPDVLVDDLQARLPVSGRGRLLDLACGTGQIGFGLADCFAEVVAVDQEAETVAFAAAKAEARGVRNIVWVTDSAETVNLEEGSFKLVAIGNAFHRLDRQVVAQRAFGWLQAGGGLALLWGGIPDRGNLPWQKALEECFADWMNRLNVSDRVPWRWQAVMDADPHAQVLRRAGFDYRGRFDFTAHHTWTVETLIGFAYSTSFLNRPVLEERAAEFGTDLTERLLAVEYAYELAVKPEPD